MRVKNLFLILIATLFLVGCSGSHSVKSYTWERITVDSTYDEMEDLSATEAIAKYKDLVDPLQEIIGYSADEYDKERPESGLSNFAADVIRVQSEKIFGKKMDLAMTNFGGIRTSLPKGAIRVYDIYSIFPFDNALVYVEILGSDLLKFFDKLASRNNPEALSGVKLVVEDRAIKEFLIGGKKIDKNRVYNFATIDFLLEGGDGIQLIDIAQTIHRSETYLRDAVINHIKEQSNGSEPLKLEKDSRVIVKR